MAFLYQKRISLGKGLGLNISKSGVSSSYRTKMGSIGSRGFSLKTGIPGLTWRSNWGKSKEGLLIMLMIFLIGGVFIVAWNILRLLYYLLSSGYIAIKQKFKRYDN